MQDKQTVTILIPAYNEEKSIGKCVKSCLNQTRRVDEVVVVNDGSTDNTLNLLKSFGSKIRIIDLKKNTGNKSKAQEIGLRCIKTDIFITTDADTRLHRNFVKNILKNFDDPEVSAVCGFIESEKDNFYTRVREINYILSQTIYKKAQNEVGAIIVLAGCSSAFKTDVFKKIVKFDHDNITEDLDFTYKLKLADKKIKYDENAVVYTQDPNNFKSYFKQLYRWYSGGWTCLKKNFRILKKPNNALILSLVYMDALIIGSLALIAPILLFWNPLWFLYLVFAQLGFTVIAMTFGIIKMKRYDLYFYLPHYYIMNFMDQALFIFTFVKEVIVNKKNMKWHKADRY